MRKGLYACGVYLSVAILRAFAPLPGVAAQSSPAPRSVTFSKDVAPILQQKCQACHRPGGMGPMSLTTYKETRPWARAIKQKVEKRDMPPWFIDKTIGIQEFQNDVSLTDEQIATILRWVDLGAPEGNPGDLPPAKAFSSDWAIGSPDLIVPLHTQVMYARGSDWWGNVSVDSGLTEDRWVKAVQIKPSDPRIVHHACGGARSNSDARSAQEEPVVEDGTLGCFFPGYQGRTFGKDTGLLLKKGARLGFSFHYFAIGEEATDRLSVGFVFYPKGVVPKFAVASETIGYPTWDIDIRPNSRAEYESFLPLRKPARILSYIPHMHIRGAAQRLDAILPTGKQLTLSAVRYDFNWQLEYIYADHVAPLLPAGTMLRLISLFDNTSANPRNPDPGRWVGNGQASTEEMAAAIVKLVYLAEDDFQQQLRAREAREIQPGAGR